MKAIGIVQLVQIQRSSLKVGEGDDRRYDPSPILRVDHLRLSARGVVGVTEDGTDIIDVHHPAHEFSRNNGDNGISIGFNSHYRTIRERLGDHLPDGIAGENILVQAERPFRLEDFQHGIAIESTLTGETYRFQVNRPIAPCEQFSRYCAGRKISGSEMKDTLQFLHQGQRGFMMTLQNPDVQPIIRLGDRVFLIEA
jgi:hypothetical protein